MVPLATPLVGAYAGRRPRVTLREEGRLYEERVISMGIGESWARPRTEGASIGLEEGRLYGESRAIL